MLTDAQIWTAAILTIAVWTFLWKETVIYQIAEHAYVGLATAWQLGFVFHNYLKTAFQNEVMANGRWDFLLPVLLGLMIYFRYSPQLSWVARYPLSFWVAYGAGFVLAFQPRVLLGQITASFNWTPTSVDNIILMVGLLATLMYFFFTVRRDSPAVGIPASVGRWFIMIALGAGFGNTVLFRATLFMGRAQFMLDDFIPTLLGG